jgi:hypothetical protein
MLTHEPREAFLGVFEVARREDRLAGVDASFVP